MKAAAKTGKTTLPDFSTLCELAKTKRAELIAYAKQAVNLDASVEKAQKAFDGCKKFAAKVLAAMKIAHEQAKAAGDISPDMPFAEYHEQVTGGKPNPHILSMATLFNRLVETGHVKENVFDAQPNDAIEKANEAITAIIDKYKGTGTDPKTSKEFGAVVKALNEPGDAVATIKDIKAEVKPSKRKSKADKDADAEAKEPFTLRVTKLTPELALQLDAKIWADGQQDVVIATLPDHFAALTPETRRSTFLTLDAAMSRLWKTHEAEFNGWVAAKEAASAPVQLVAAGIPAHTPGTPQPQLQAA